MFCREVKTSVEKKKKHQNTRVLHKHPAAPARAHPPQTEPGERPFPIPDPITLSWGLVAFWGP